MVICPRCNEKNKYEAAYCFSCGLILSGVKKTVAMTHENGIYPTELKIDEYAVSVDLSVSESVRDIPIVAKAATMLIEYWSKPINRTNLLGNAVRIGPNQISSVYEIVEELARRLGVEVPETYIKYDPTFNAMTLGSNRDHLVIIHSALMDNFTREELMFVIGHELGHIKSNHVTYNTIAYLCALGLGGFVAAAFRPLLLAIEAWQRRAEITADRAGLLACGDPVASVQALTMFALGSRKLLDEFSLPDFLSQEQDIDRIYDVLNKAFAGLSHPYTVVRVREMLDFYFSDTARILLERLKKRYGQPNKQKIALPPKGPEAQSPNVTAITNRFCSSCGFRAGIKDQYCRVCGGEID